MLDAGAEFSPALKPALTAIRSATAGMTDEQLVWHPEGKWSSAEILEHLALAYARTVERMKPLLQEGSPEIPERTLKEWIGRLIVLKLGFIPSGRKAPEALVPNGLGPAEAKSCIEEKLWQLDQAAEQCEKRFGGANVLVQIAMGPLSAAEWRRFHYAHTLHHMKQIHALRRLMNSGS